MSKTTSKKQISPSPGFQYQRTIADIEEYVLKTNGLHVLYLHRPNTGIVTTNITYRVGSRDEQIGETGLAHMLEHMLFKPTLFDKARGTDSAAMLFEREVGCTLNANTWRDRTTYFFSYPTEHFERAITIEAERMTGVILTPEELAPEQQNVLSEFDMYNGDPEFALGVQVTAAGFSSHPYHHETIGFREDIEAYTAEKLELFYRTYYRPDNTTLMIIGDIEAKQALMLVKKQFGHIEAPALPLQKNYAREPKQEGVRRVNVVRPTQTNLLHIGFRHAGFPSPEWYTASIASAVIAGGPESILHKLLVDSGKATSVHCGIEPVSDPGLGVISITLAPGMSHQTIEELVLKALRVIPVATLAPLVKKVKARLVTKELFDRDHSLKIAATLTEYVAAGQITAYATALTTIETLTPSAIADFIHTACDETTLTIGNFVGTKK